MFCLFAKREESFFLNDFQTSTWSRILLHPNAIHNEEHKLIFKDDGLFGRILKKMKTATTSLQFEK